MIIDQLDYWAMMEPFSVEVKAFAETGDELVFSAIFDNEHKQFGDEFGISNSSPSLLCRAIDVENVVQTDPILVDGTSYKIRDVQPDGAGLIRMELKR